MDLRADMVGDEADDALAIGERQPLARIGEPVRKTIDPEPAVGVEHHLDDFGIFEKSGYCRAKGGAQHARAPDYRLGLLVRARHIVPFFQRTAKAALARG
jgi:hypothetical protein